MDERRGALPGARVVVGVTGSVAAYKAAVLVSDLVKQGARVDVLLTPSGRQFVTETTFRSLTDGLVAWDAFDPSAGRLAHIEVAHAADLMAVVPASANTLANLAHGSADTLVTLAALSCTAPVMVAPAMEAAMWQHPATQRNVATLRGDGVHIAGPAEGRHASGAAGPGRMLEPEQLLGHMRMLLGRSGDLAGRRVVVTAGGTREPVDAVRTLGNRSSGKMGIAIARAARDRGARVTLVSTADPIADGAGIEQRAVATAADMLRETSAACDGADLLLMAAAVADFRPAEPAAGKLHRADGVAAIALEANPDIVATIGGAAGEQRPKVVVAFAAETEELVTRAREKLERKGVDLIAANLVGAGAAGERSPGEGAGGFGGDQGQLTILGRRGEPQELPLLPKEQAAHVLLDQAAARL